MSVFEQARDGKDARQECQELPASLKGEYRLDACLKYAREQQVYRLLRTWDDACFLLKVAGEQAAPFLWEEYRFLKELSFPFLPKAMDCFEEQGRVYLLREYLPGKTLYDMVEAQGALPPPKAVLLTLSVCRMLHSFHTRRPPLIHRDIKPQNILYSPQGICFLLDVGSLRAYEPRKSQDTVVMLTQATAAPEQFGFQQSDMRTDVYAVGKLLYYLLTGHFSADEPELGEVPVWLRPVLRKCLSFSPRKRYQSAASLEKALRGWLRLRSLGPALLSLAAVFLLGFGLSFGFFAGRMAAPAQPAGADIETGVPAQELAQSVTFVEPKIEEAVRLVLGKADSDPIFPKELGLISQIVICGNTVYPDTDAHRMDEARHHLTQAPKGVIHSLEDLGLLPNLQTVVLDRQPISDVGPFTKLPWLEELSLCYCRVTDLTPLSGCPWLQELYLEGNPLEDLSPVPEFRNLKTLSIPRTQVADISALEGLGLENLNITGLPIQDYAALDSLSLSFLDADHLPESALPSLARMPRLRGVGLIAGHYQDLRIFSTFPALEHLGLAQCEIDDLSDLSGFPLVNSLDVYGQKLESLTPFLALDKLEYITMSYATVQDISALPRFTGVKELWVDEDMARRIAQTFPGVAFSFEIIVDRRFATSGLPPAFRGLRYLYG